MDDDLSLFHRLTLIDREALGLYRPRVLAELARFGLAGKDAKKIARKAVRKIIGRLRQGGPPGTEGLSVGDWALRIVEDEALAALYDRHDGALVRALRRLCRPGEDAREYAALAWEKVFLSLREKRFSFNPTRGAFFPWLAMVARNVRNDARRARNRQPVGRSADDLDAVPAPDSGVEAVDEWDAREYLRDAVDWVLRTWGPEERMIVEFWFQGLRQKDIAKRVGMNQGTVSRILSRFRDSVQRIAKRD